MADRALWYVVGQLVALWVVLSVVVVTFGAIFLRITRGPRR